MIVDGAVCDLTPLENSLLRLLGEYKGIPIPGNIIKMAVWDKLPVKWDPTRGWIIQDNQAVSSEGNRAALETRISRLREKLGDSDLHNPLYIQSFHTLGYRLINLDIYGYEVEDLFIEEGKLHISPALHAIRWNYGDFIALTKTEWKLLMAVREGNTFTEILLRDALGMEDARDALRVYIRRIRKAMERAGMPKEVARETMATRKKQRI